MAPEPAAPEAPGEAAPPAPVAATAGPRGLDDAPFAVRVLPSAAVAGGVALAVLLLTPAYFVETVEFALLALVTPIGQELWLVAAPARFGLPLPFVAAILLAMNLSLSLFFALALPMERLIARIPRVGRRVARFEARIRRSRFFRRGVATALAVIVMLPFHSGGAVLGSLAGRSLGLPWRTTVAAVMAGVVVRLGALTAVAYGVLSLPGA